MSGRNEQDTASNNAAGGAGTWFADWSARTPVTTRYTLITIVAATLIGMFTGLSELTALCPATAVFGLQIWRFFTSPIIQNGFLSLLFVVLWFAQQGTPLEQKHGSVGLLYLMGLLGIVTNLIYAFGGLLLAYNPIAPMELMMGCSGSFWPILVGLITCECLENPEGSRKFFFFPCMIKNRFFPWVVAAFFCVLGGIATDIIIGVCTGHLYAYGKLDRFKPTPERLESLESGSLAGLASQQGFIAAAVAGSDLALPTQAPSGGGGGAAAGGAAVGSSSGWVSRSGGDVFGRGGGNNAGSRGGSPAGAGGAAAPQAPKFPGSGKTLASGSSSASSTTRPSGDDDRRRAAAAAAEARAQAAARGGSLPSSQVPPSGGGTAPSFALPTRITSGGSSGPPSALDGAGVQTLVSMGYSQDQASYALLQTNGNLDAAIGLLSGSK